MSGDGTQVTSGGRMVAWWCGTRSGARLHAMERRWETLERSMSGDGTGWRRAEGMVAWCGDAASGAQLRAYRGASFARTAGCAPSNTRVKPSRVGATITCDKDANATLSDPLGDLFFTPPEPFLCKGLMSAHRRVVRHPDDEWAPLMVLEIVIKPRQRWHQRSQRGWPLRSKRGWRPERAGQACRHRR